MKKLFIAIAMFAIAALLSGVVYAQTYSNTLYNQEGTGSDGYSPINASGQGPAGDDSDNYTNWKWKSGSGSWSGVYSWDTDAWLTIDQQDDEGLKIECDIEMYCATTTVDNEIYFHLGNPYSASPGNLTAYVTGTMTSNNGQYLGISFEGTSKDEDSFEKDV